jgi:hypothetical protein
MGTRPNRTCTGTLQRCIPVAPRLVPPFPAASTAGRHRRRRYILGQILLAAENQDQAITVLKIGLDAAERIGAVTLSKHILELINKVTE